MYTQEPDKTERTERGVWHLPDGTTQPLDEIAAWTKMQALANTYLYQIMLSLRDAAVDEEVFLGAMQAGSLFADYRLIQHRDTDHHHVHVITFRPKRIDKPAFNQFRLQSRAYLEQTEMEALIHGQYRTAGNGMKSQMFSG